MVGIASGGFVYPASTAAGLAEARNRSFALRSLLLNGVYNVNTPGDDKEEGEDKDKKDAKDAKKEDDKDAKKDDKEREDPPTLATVLAAAGLVDAATVAKAKAIIEADEQATEGAAAERWFEERGAIMMRAAGLYVHPYTALAQTSVGLCMGPYESLVSDPFLSMILPFAGTPDEVEAIAHGDGPVPRCAISSFQVCFHHIYIYELT